jgi:hypothetical protein
MNEIQRKATAAGFVHALKKSPELRDSWAAIAKSDNWAAKLCALIGQTVGTEPSLDDLAGMRDYCNSHLQEQLDDLQQLDARIEPMYVCNGRLGG